MPTNSRSETTAPPAVKVARASRAERGSKALVIPEGSPHRHDDLLQHSLAYTIKRAQVRCDEALTRHLDAGLSPARFAALCAVGANPGISQAALGGLLGIAGPSVVKVVDELEKLDLVKRASSTDRRVYALQLTDHGEVDLERYEISIQTFEKKISEGLTAQERSQLLKLLAKVAASGE